MHAGEHIVWGPELSPFLLKLESMLAFAGVPFRRLPRDGSRLENLRTDLLLQRAKRSRTAHRPPVDDPLDEYPLVPFLVTPDRRVLYDSSALAGWLDRGGAGAGTGATGSGAAANATRTDAADATGGRGSARVSDRPPLVPAAGALRFVTLFLDEAFDELGLYLVHHNRWKLAAADNDAPGSRLAREYRRHMPPVFAPLLGRWFARRQVRRLPYLFSVAPAGYRVPGLPAALTPPSRPGFPPTHDLLEETWTRVLAAMEGILSKRPFLLGEGFTLADASAYGQLSMNLTDGLAARRLRELAPVTFDWLVSIRDRRHVGASGPVGLHEDLGPLLGLFLETFVPLMRANAEAVARLQAAGETLFNEPAFDAGRSLYDGRILGHPFRSVAKTFQARAWRDLVGAWEALGEAERAEVAGLFPEAGRVADPGTGQPTDQLAGLGSVFVLP